MTELPLHPFHQSLGATFTEVNSAPFVAHYGDPLAEHAAITASGGVMDLTGRGRLCLLGADRLRFLHGQVTNNIRDLRPGQSCYAAITNNKGKLQGDANVHCLPDELLLDVEPGLTAALTQRLEKYIIADDVQVIDAAPHYGLLAVQGPRSAEAVKMLDLGFPLPANQFTFTQGPLLTFGEIYCMNQPRGATPAFDFSIPIAALDLVADKLLAAARALGGTVVGWQAWETARIENGIPRFGVDMDETTLAPEAGLDTRAISYQKGCYIGQEVINRVRSRGQLTRALRGLRLTDTLPALPVRGDKLLLGDKEVGFVTSAVASPRFKANLALGYVRCECHQPGSELTLRTAAGDSPARVVELPFA